MAVTSGSETSPCGHSEDRLLIVTARLIDSATSKEGRDPAKDTVRVAVLPLSPEPSHQVGRMLSAQTSSDKHQRKCKVEQNIR